MVPKCFILFNCHLLIVVWMCVTQSVEGCSRSCDDDDDVVQGEVKATCMLQQDPASTQAVSGLILFTQKPGEVINVSVNITGLDAVTAGSASEKFDHGFHVHEFGDINGGCKSAGGHYNPKGVNHGGSTADVRHPGDFGNLQQTPDGKIVTSFTDRLATMFGAESIIGRAIVLHAGQDDLGLGGDAGSIANGNAGARIGCCVIGYAKGSN